jgi:ABC-type transport system involved in multi-copper enzyme maturation permease subunit
LLAAFAGSGIIARDLQENSISLYLSRPITWYDYLGSKFSSLMILLSTITLFPAVVLFSTGMAFSNKDISYILEHMYILSGMLISYLLALVLFSSVSMAFSTLIRKWIFSGVAIFVFFIFTSTVSDILVALFDNDYLRLMNINFVMKNIFKPLFGLEYARSSTGIEWYWLAITLVMIIFVSWSVLIIKFRNREVAK